MKHVAIALGLSLFVGTACAAEAPPAGFAFTGAWHCEGSFHGNGKRHVSRFEGRQILDGNWTELVEEDIEPVGYKGTYLIGWDKGRKAMLEFQVSNFGGTSFASDQGWHDGVLTMVSDTPMPVGTPYVASRFVYKVAGPNAFSIDWEVQRVTAGEWTPADHLACSRKTA
jgi:hypothetical protein